MYDNRLLSHETRCNSMITVMKPNESKNNIYKPLRGTRKAPKPTNCKITHAVPRDGDKPDYRYSINYLVDGVSYTRSKFLNNMNISESYLSVITTNYESCEIDGYECSFGYMPKKVTKYKLTMQDGTIYDKVTAEFISKKFNVCKQYIYSLIASGRNEIKGNIIEKVEE